jgi:hypothetical protein
MTDIVERLREWGDVDKFPNPMQILNQFRQERFEAADEIELLTRCLGIAAGYISATPGWTDKHPQQVVTMIRDAVIRGDEEDD